MSRVLSRILAIVILILIVANVWVHLFVSNVDKDLEGKAASVQTLQTQVADAQTTNQTLTQYKTDNYITWRNAQGRLSLLGDGSGKVCYLTFDDGPSNTLTQKNLDILTRYGIHATWFLLGDAEEFSYLDLSLAKTIEEQGSAVGIHDWNQDSKYLYYKGDVENYFTSDFNKTKEVLEAVVGHEIKICRFAGGSTTIAYYNKAIGKTLPQAVLERGYQYFDWNVLAGDSESSQFVNGSKPAANIVSDVLSEAEYYAKRDSPICILMHDNPGKETTTEALPEIIEGLQALGYTFDVLSYDSPGFYQAVIV